jgi:hypothetical protein
MQCNIDERGRRARLVSGIITDALGVGVLVAGIVAERTELIVAGAVCMGIGTFMVFEGVKGWCALRALGVKTPL